jgi:hypothetical protein
MRDMQPNLTKEKSSPIFDSIMLNNINCRLLIGGNPNMINNNHLFNLLVQVVNAVANWKQDVVQSFQGMEQLQPAHIPLTESYSWDDEDEDEDEDDEDEDDDMIDWPEDDEDDDDYDDEDEDEDDDF